METGRWHGDEAILDEYVERAGEFAEPPEEVTRDWLIKECADRARAVRRIWEHLEGGNRAGLEPPGEKDFMRRRTTYFQLQKNWAQFFKRFEAEENVEDIEFVEVSWEYPLDINQIFMDLEDIVNTELEDLIWFAAVLWKLKKRKDFMNFKRPIKKIINVSLLNVITEARILRNEFGRK